MDSRTVIAFIICESYTDACILIEAKPNRRYNDIQRNLRRVKRMKKENKLQLILYFVTSACFFLGALLSKNYLFAPVGVCFALLGFMNAKANSDNDKKRRK